MFSDLKLAVRTLRKSPAFVAVATTALALGIALASTMFSMLDAVVHPHVPYREPDRLVAIVPFGSGGSGSVSRAEIYQALKEGTKSFEEIAGTIQTGLLVQAPGYAGDHNAYYVTENYFGMLGLKPELGRGFPPGVSGPDAGIVISYALWKRAFPGRSFAPGLTITAGDRRYEVAGVLPYEMGTPLWLRAEPFDEVMFRSVVPIGRLRPGVTLDDARREIELIAARLTREYGAGREPFSFQLRPFTPVPGELQDYHAALFGGAIAVLLLACANLANLMYARGLSRRRELAVRLAIGATRGRLVRQLLAEAVVIALVGAALGCVLASWGIDLVRRNMPTETPTIGRLMPHLDLRFLLFALFATTLAVVLFGLFPAIRSSSIAVSDPLKDGAAASTGRNRQRYSGVVIAEIALCLAVLMGAFLLTRALKRVESASVGYDPRGLLAASVRLSAREVPSARDLRGRYEGVLDRLRSHPQTVDAATISAAAPAGLAVTSDMEGAEQKFTNVRKYQVVSPNFLRVLGVPIVEGRNFEPGDADATTVALVDQAAVEQLWAGRSPVGRMIKLGGPSTSAPWVRVVGVVPTVRLNEALFDPFTGSGLVDPFTGHRFVMPNIFVVQPGENFRAKQVVARVTGDEVEAMGAFARELNASFPQSMRMWGAGRFYPYLQTFRDLLDTRRFLAGLFSFFAVFSLVLAGVGLYGVLAYSVSQRMREFGVRIALGAQAGNLLRLVVHDGAVMALAGTAAGAWLAMGANSLLNYWLFDLTPTDVVSLVSAEGVLIAVSLLACWAPARRASRADPMEILRAT